jgi:type II secretory pathway component PulF
MVRNGTPLPDALALAQSLESTTPVARPLAQWQQHLAAGAGKPGQLPTTMRPLPALFLWLVHQSGEDVAAGFQRAADVYQARANYRTDLLLYGALPVSLLSLGLLVIWQITPLMQSMTNLMNSIGGD